jgi:hypothetical protein
MNHWQEIASAPGGEVVETKVDDARGERNVTLLKRSGRMWWFPDDSMYVYYAPTHWRRPTPDQLEQLARKADQKAQLEIARAKEYRALSAGQGE